MTKKEDEIMAKFIKENPSQVMMFMMIQMGKMVVESNAATCDIKQEMTLDGQRYEVKAKITAKRIKMPKP